MTHQSISFTDQSNEWLRHKVEVEGEYKTNSDAINDLIHREQQREQAKVAANDQGQTGGISTRAADEIMRAVLKSKTDA